MVNKLGNFIGWVINIIMAPIFLIVAIPIGIIKRRRQLKHRQLFTGKEQSLLSKAQHILQMDSSGLLSPDRDILEIARCIDNARCEYQIIKSREKFESSFFEFVEPKMKRVNVSNWSNIDKYFELTSSVYQTFSGHSFITDTNKEDAIFLGSGIRLDDAAVDILFLVKDDDVKYLNSDLDHLYTEDSEVYEVLNGRVVNFVFSGQSDKSIIEVFVAFDEEDSYNLFTLQLGVNERFNSVAQSILTTFLKDMPGSIFSRTESYHTQYIYAFKLAHLPHSYVKGQLSTY